MKKQDIRPEITPSIVAKALDGAQVMIRDLDGTILYWSSGVAQLYGFSNDEAVGHSSHALLGTIFPQPLETMEKALLSTGQWSGDLRHTCKDGRSIVVATHWSLHRSGRHTVVAEVNNDITDQIALKADQAMLATIVAQSDDAIMSKSLDGTILSWNAAAERMLGYQAQEALGQNVRMLFPPHLVAEEARILERLKAGEKVELLETTRRRKDGTDIAVSLRVSPIHDRAGNVVAASKILRDITARKESEKKIEDIQSQLTTVSRANALGTMSAWIAHEINQPLTAIANYMSALNRIAQAGFRNTDTMREIVQKTGAQAIRASEIMRRLRGMVQGTSHRERDSIGAIVGEAIELARPITRRYHVELSAEIAPDLPEIFVDRIQIQQVLLNLIRNAAEAMKGASTRSVRISVRRDDAGILMDVSDSGPGLPEEVSRHLFEPFVTSGSGGMGIGLSVCKAIVDRHDGAIRVSPGPEHGTCFTVQLPCAEKQSAA